MTIRKLRDLDDLTPSPSAGWPESLRSAFELSYLCIKLSGRKPKPGIRRYRSLEEAASDTDLTGDC